MFRVSFPSETSLTLCNSEFSEQTGFPMMAKRVKPWQGGMYFYAPFAGGIIVIRTDDRSFTFSENMSVQEFKQHVNNETFKSPEVIDIPANKYIGVPIYRELKNFI